MSIDHPNATTEAYQQSLEMLRRCLTPAGFVVSPVDVDNAACVWARDGIITGLAALASDDDALVKGMEHTLDTLAKHQGPHGEIPSSVSLDGTHVSYGQLAGRVDALLWYVIGVCAYLNQTRHASRKVRYWLTIEKALFLAGCWEYNNRGLLYTPISGDWADEYVLQGYVLYDVLLYQLALRSAGAVFSNKDWQKKAEELLHLLTINYWPRREFLESPQVYHPQAYRPLAEQGAFAYWLAAFSPAGYTTTFDGLAQALSLLADLGDSTQKQQLQGFVQSLEQQIGSALLPAFWPVIQPGDKEWAALEANHVYGQIKNQPYVYHNAGLWPLVTGFYALGLMHQGQKEQAQHLLATINAANKLGREGQQWEFAEYHHGQTHQPLGTQHIAGSAAAGVLVYQAIERGVTPWPL